VTDDRRPTDASRYRLNSRIATGGMGEVWRATDGVLGREVAVKLLKREYADDPTFRSRFETEARNAAALHHPNVASVFDFGELPAREGEGAPQPYLVMELVRGEPLSALLRNGEPMPAESAIDLITQAAAAITAAHALGIVHRDVKPANLLVTPDKTLKITDFGIARAADAVALTQTGQVVGTPQYLSPEQAEGKQATQASDIYSLGVVLYECLAGRRPFDGDSPIATALSHLRDEPPPLPDEVPEHLRETVRVALAKDPAARFASAAAFATALRGGPVHTGGADPDASSATSADAPTLVAGAATAPLAAPAVAPVAAPVAASGTGPPTRTTGPTDPGPPQRRRPWLPWVAAALAVLVVVLVVSRLTGDRSPGTSSDQPSGPTATSTVTERSSSSAAPTKTASASPTKTASSAPTTSATPDETVAVDPADYVGRPAKDATKQLEDLGLTVEVVTVENPGDQEKDTVAAVSPSGDVDPDQTITLSVYGDPPADNPAKKPPKSPKGPDGDNGNGNGNGNGDGEGPTDEQ
jgi:serine/threonine-protein kinase